MTRGVHRNMGAWATIGFAAASASCVPYEGSRAPRRPLDAGRIVPPSAAMPDPIPPEPCSTPSATEPPSAIDVVWVVDSSSSMNDEAKIVHDNMMGFVESIEAAEIDFRAVLITDSDFLVMPEPLAGDEERFLPIDRFVGSNDPLVALFAEYPLYRGFLRSGADLHFVAITDDESRMFAHQFLSLTRARVGSFVFHAIASEPDPEQRADVDPDAPKNPRCRLGPGCRGPHGEATCVGSQYYALARMTGGATFSVCAADWSKLFAELAGTIMQPPPVPCPQAPDPVTDAGPADAGPQIVY